MNITASGTNRPESAVASARPKASARLLFIDNIRVFLTILVLLFHMMIIYAGTGSWLYSEGRQDEITSLLGAWFVAVTQAYFMGLFLFVSAYFVPGSYDRKGAGRFMKDRLIRLGIPLVIYSWIIDPLLGYVVKVWREGPRPFYWSDLFGHFRDGALIGSGPLWFVETLLIFSLGYTLWRSFTRGRPVQRAGESRFPSSVSIALLALLLGVAGYLIRLWLPIGYNFQPLNLQFPILCAVHRSLHPGFGRLPPQLAFGVARKTGPPLANHSYRLDPVLPTPGNCWRKSRTICRWLELAGFGLRPLGVLPLPWHVHRLDLHFPALCQPPGRAGQIPLTERLHSLHHPRPGDNLPGLGSARRYVSPVAEVGLVVAGGCPALFCAQRTDPQDSLYGSSFITAKFK